MQWNRPSGNPIDLKDTPEMEKFANSKGWTKEDPTDKKAPKKSTKKAD